MFSRKDYRKESNEFSRTNSTKKFHDTHMHTWISNRVYTTLCKVGITIASNQGELLGILSKTHSTHASVTDWIKLPGY